MVLGVAAAAGLAVAAVFAGRGWIAGTRPLALYVGLVVAAAAVPLALLWAINLPSDECTGEKAEAFEQWGERGGLGDPPYDCVTY